MEVDVRINEPAWPAFSWGRVTSSAAPGMNPGTAASSAAAKRPVSACPESVVE